MQSLSDPSTTLASRLCCLFLHCNSLLLLIDHFVKKNTRMESLLCNEVWLTSPNAEENDGDGASIDDAAIDTPFVSTNSKQDCEEAFAAFLAKETRYLPQSSYPNLLQTHRFKAVAWIIKSQRRMELCGETVFGAVNCLDRFISLTQCQGWQSWMFELLSIACLSIAAKFNETSAYLLHEFQEDLENSFAPNLIQRMELTVLKSLDWRVDSVTPFSCIHLSIQTIDAFNKTLVEELTKRTTQLLLHLLSDPKFLEFQHCVVAVSAVKTVVQDLLPSSREYASFANLDALIPQDHKDDMIHCQRLMRKLLVRDETIYSCSSPSSPVTVLKVDLFNSFDLRWSRERKRKREEVEEGL